MPATPSTAEPAPADWGDRVGDTSLSIRVPAADALVTTGFPAHVSVLHPFVPRASLGPASRAALAALVAAHPPFTLRFTRFGHFPGVLHIAPEPHPVLHELSAALRRAWPGALPYRGLFGPEGLPPHLTLATHAAPGTDRAVYGPLEERYGSALPLHAEVNRLSLTVYTPEGTWREESALSLGGERVGGERVAG
ncbi:2'-5' RNA ligase family protein [Streptomyces sp. NPDC001255]|uniref:2'-5' RNA ligase family protein n=1 Tax=Streptomyces sp. NPDC001255 TaxID=3364550 RepID=UPI0036A8D3E9